MPCHVSASNFRDAKGFCLGPTGRVAASAFSIRGALGPVVAGGPRAAALKTVKLGYLRCADTAASLPA